MRVGLLIYGSLDTLSGGYLYDRKLVEVLEHAGHPVEIVSLPWRSYLRHLGDNFDLAFLHRLSSLDVDVLIQDELNHPSLFHLNARLRGRVKYRLVGLVHHLRISERHPRVWMPLYRAVERRYLGSLDAFIFNSRTTQAVVERLVGRFRPAIVATPAGDRLPIEISADRIRERAAEPGPLRILFLGNVIPRKGLHDLLNALARLDPSAWRLAVAGGLDSDLAYSQNIIRWVQRKGLAGQVDFRGPVRDAELLPLLYDSQVLAMPSQYEGFGIAYLEGMGAGLPAVAGQGGAAHEVVRDGENGYLVNPADPARLAEILSSLNANRAVLAEMGTRARETFLRRPGWHESLERVVKFLAELTDTS